MAAPHAFTLRFPPGFRNLPLFTHTPPPLARVTVRFLPGSPTSEAARFGTETRLDIRLARPEDVRISGPFSLNFNSGTAVTLDRARFSEAELLSALNAIDAVRTAGLVSRVIEVRPGLFEVRFRSNGAQSAFVMDHPDLGDLSADRVSSVQTGTGSLPSIQRLDFRVHRLARITSFSNISAGSVSVETVHTGTSSSPQVDRIDFGPLAEAAESGAFTLSADGGTTWTAPISFPPTPYLIERALDAVSGLDGKFSVTRAPDETERAVYTIERTENGVNTALQATGALRWPEGKSCEVDFSVLRRRLERHTDCAASGPVELEWILETGADLSDSAQPVELIMTGRMILEAPLSGPSVAAPAELAS